METKTVPMATQVVARHQGPGMVPLLPITTAQPYTPPQEVKEERPGEGSFERNFKDPYLEFGGRFAMDYPDDDDDTFRAPEHRQKRLEALKKLQSENSGFDIPLKDKHGVDNYFKPGIFSGKVPTKKAYEDVMGKFRALQDTTHPVIKRQTKAALTISKIRRGKMVREKGLLAKKRKQQTKTAKITKQVDKLLPHLDYAGGKRKHRRTKRRKKRKKKRRKKTRKHKRRKRRKTRKR